MKNHYFRVWEVRVTARSFSDSRIISFSLVTKRKRECKLLSNTPTSTATLDFSFAKNSYKIPRVGFIPCRKNPVIYQAPLGSTFKSDNRASPAELMDIRLKQSSGYSVPSYFYPEWPVGVGVKWENVLCLDTSTTLASSESLSLQVAELAGIDIILGHILKLIERQQNCPPFLTIYTTSRRVLQAITQNNVSSGQFLLRQMRNKYHQILQSTGMQIRIVIETHSNPDPASRAADLLAKKASQLNQRPLLQLNFPPISTTKPLNVFRSFSVFAFPIS